MTRDDLTHRYDYYTSTNGIPFITIDLSKHYIVDDGFMPVCLPRETIDKDQTCTLSIHPQSVRDISFKEKYFTFKASFNKYVVCLQVPYEAVMYLFNNNQ